MHDLCEGPAVKNIIKNYLREENGATAIEYGLIIAGISIAILATVLLIGDWGVDTFETIQSYF